MWFVSHLPRRLEKALPASGRASAGAPSCVLWSHVARFWNLLASCMWSDLRKKVPFTRPGVVGLLPVPGDPEARVPSDALLPRQA